MSASPANASVTPPATAVLALQRTVGNRALARALQRQPRASATKALPAMVRNSPVSATLQRATPDYNPVHLTRYQLQIVLRDALVFIRDTVGMEFPGAWPWGGGSPGGQAQRNLIGWVRDRLLEIVENPALADAARATATATSDQLELAEAYA